MSNKKKTVAFRFVSDDIYQEVFQLTSFLVKSNSAANPQEDFEPLIMTTDEKKEFNRFLQQASDELFNRVFAYVDATTPYGFTNTEDQVAFSLVLSANAASYIEPQIDRSILRLLVLGIVARWLVDKNLSLAQYHQSLYEQLLGDFKSLLHLHQSERRRYRWF